MFRSPLELETQSRFRIAQVAEERRRCSLINQATARLPSPLTQLRRRLGFGLIQAGKIIAGLDTLQRLPTPQAWPGPPTLAPFVPFPARHGASHHLDSV